MTGRHAGPEWDDARIVAAFAARAAARPTVPRDLVPSVMDALRRGPQPQTSPARGWLAAAAAVALTVGIAGIAAIALSSGPRSLASRPPDPDGSGILDEVGRELGLIPIGVADAIAIRDAGGGEELLVTGYLSNDPSRYVRGDDFVASCGRVIPPTGTLLQPNCTPMLMADPESIVTRRLTSIDVREPRGPAFHPLFDVAPPPVTEEIPLIGDARPTAISVVGHFHDRRSASCFIGTERACGTTFVVDKVVAVDGLAVSVAPTLDVDGESAEEALREAVPGLIPVQSARVERETLGLVEPTLADGAAVPAEIDADVVHLIRAIPAPDGSGAPRSIRTFVVGDGIGVVVEMTDDGPVVRHPAPTPLPSVPVATTVAGDPISVSDAIAIRDTAGDDREIAVMGYLSEVPLLFCPSVNAPANPTDLHCPETSQWLMERPEILRTTSGAGTTGRPPTGAAIHPSFRLVDEPLRFDGGSGLGAAPLGVVLIGHFDDRRAALCPAAPSDDPPCANTFLVDRVESVDGPRRPVATAYDNLRSDATTGSEVAEYPVSAQPDVDALIAVAAPADTLVSRRLVTGDRVERVEPVLGGDPTFSDARLIWLLTTVGRGIDGRPIARTFAVLDGATAVVEVTSRGPVIVPIPEPLAPSDPATGDPFAGAPTSVFGIGVGSIRTTLDLHPQRDSAEVAVRGWYVPPDPAASCPLLHDPIRPVDVPCNQGRHWLLDRSEQLWADPLKVDIDRQPTGVYLNPIIPFDVSIDVPSGWEDGSPEPWPVVLLGHFADPRTSTQSGRLEFTVDEIAWQRAHLPGSGPAVSTARFQIAIESEDVVRRRIDDRLGPSLATWLTVVSGAHLQIVDPDVEPGRTELAEAPVVWIARRLVERHDGNVVTRVVTTALTVDGSDRIWERRDCCSFELATTIDLDLSHAADDDGLLRVADDLGRVKSARIDPRATVTAWRTIGPEGYTTRVGATGDPRELAISWNWPTCESTWRLHITPELWIGFSPEPMVTGSCPAPPAPTIVVLTFRDPVDVGAVHTDEYLSGG